MMPTSKFQNPLSGFTVQRLFLFIVGILALVQIFSLIISFIFKDVGIFKGGQLLIVLSIFLTFALLTRFVFKQEFQRIDLLLIIIMGGVTYLLFTYGANYFPFLFSLIDSSAVESAQSLASTIGLP